jgi:hypothetical protein
LDFGHFWTSWANQLRDHLHHPESAAKSREPKGQLLEKFFTAFGVFRKGERAILQAKKRALTQV